MEGSNNKLIDDSFTCQKENGRLQKSVMKKNVRHYCKILFTYMLKSISFEIHIPVGNAKKVMTAINKMYVGH